MKRYESSENIQELSKKLALSKSSFQQQILRESISTKLLAEKGKDEISKSCSTIEKMPTDNFVQFTQETESKQAKRQAEEVCHQKELAEELNLDMIDYEKYRQDEEGKENQEAFRPPRNKSRVSKARQFKFSITTRKFLQDYFGITCLQEKKLTHEEMEQIIRVEGLEIPKRGRIQNISYDQMATGEYILVRNETHKERNARIIPYMNPYGTSLEKLTQEIGMQYRNKIKYKGEIR